MQKLPANSPVKVVMTAFTIIFFVALFVWQIDRYLKVGQDSQLQSQITRMNALIETDSLTLSNEEKFAYLHQSGNIAQPLTPVGQKGRQASTKPVKTLAALLTQNQFSPSSSGSDICFLYIYLPPQMGRQAFELYNSNNPTYILAAWSDYQEKAIVASDRTLLPWLEENLTKDFFYCQPKKLRSDVLAVDKNGYKLPLPGYSFQFSELYYSQVQTP